MNELLKYNEDMVRWDSDHFIDENPALAEHDAELRGVLEHRSILRHVRLMAGLPICCGDGHCVTLPTTKCNAGHQTCLEHVESCYLCLPKTSGLHLVQEYRRD